MFMWKENTAFSSVEGGSSGLPLKLFLEVYMVLVWVLRAQKRTSDWIWTLRPPSHVGSPESISTLSSAEGQQGLTP